MTVSNLALLFSPIILYPREASFTEVLFKSKNLVGSAKSVVQVLIEHSGKL
jgi:hypothetical protein